MDRRNAIALGAGAALGGLPAMRPDQQYFPPRAAIVPGARNGLVTARRVVVIGANSGLFAYSPTLGAGNLVEAISPAGGSDQFGNVYLPGFFQVKQLAPIVAIQMNNGALAYYTAASEAGPYTARGLLALDGANSLEFSTFTSVIFNVLVNTQAGLAVIGGLTTDNLSVTGTVAAPILVSGPIAGGNVLEVDNTLAGGAAPILRVTSANTGDIFAGARVSGDTNARFSVDSTAAIPVRIRLGPGNAVPETVLQRPSANLLELLAADFAIDTIGRGLQVKEGANAKQGTAVLNGAGTVTVANTAVTANSRIFLTMQDNAQVGSPGWLRVSARVAGTSFTVTSSSGTDAGTFAYEIVEPAP